MDGEAIMRISRLNNSIGMLVGTACLVLFGNSVAAADVSASLPNGFVVMDANDPPSHEALSVVKVFWRAERFSLTEVLVHLGFHFRRPLSGVASGVSGLSVS